MPCVVLLAPGILRWFPYFPGKSMCIWLALRTVLNQYESTFGPLACIQEVSGSKLIRAPAVPRFSMFFLSVSIQKSESYTELGNDYSFTYLFQFINYHSMMFSSSY